MMPRATPHRARCPPVKEGVFREYLGRSVAKAVSYRIIVVIADFVAVFFFTGRAEVALGFVVVSNIYTSALYLFHERFWDRVAWGRGVE
jgi:uncharacterized membrane protein